MPRLWIIDVIPQDGRMITVDELPHLRVNVRAIGLALRLYLVIIGCRANGTRHKRPVVAARVVETHSQAFFTHRGAQLADDVSGCVLTIGGQLGVWR